MLFEKRVQCTASKENTSSMKWKPRLQHSSLFRVQSILLTGHTTLQRYPLYILHEHSRTRLDEQCMELMYTYLTQPEILDWIVSRNQRCMFIFLAPQDALEVIVWVGEWVSHTVEPSWLMWPWWVKIPTEDFREAPFNLSPPLFGHCPNSNYTPPALKRALWGTFFRADLSNFVKSPFWG